jgi:UDP-GlcNAc:undecaprenyl-phosphate/decaprenyl-phosphate GlcNAc-1-phosphate transferase
MLLSAVVLFLLAFGISLCGTYLARRYARRLGLMDDPGHRKVHTVATPRNGGIGIFWGFALPLLVGTGVALMLGRAPGADRMVILGYDVPDLILRHLPGMRAHVPLALLVVAATLGIHILGLLDDKKPLGPWSKLLGQVAIAAGLVFVGEFCDPVRGGAFRVLTSLGFVPSAILSILWIVALTNAFNFLDNMDGLSAGVAFICAAMFLIAAVFNQQWFVAALLLLFMGSTLGFLCFNFPPASIFMGDGGSMVLGFVLSVLTIRTTYYDSGNPQTPHHWYSVLMPLFVMAVPLYDLVIVMALRVAKGRSPMTGDTNHFSHRLTRHGFSKRAAVLIIYAVTFATGLSAPLLARVDDASALLLAGQLLAILVVIGILERVGEHTQ